MSYARSLLVTLTVLALVAGVRADEKPKAGSTQKPKTGDTAKSKTPDTAKSKDTPKLSSKDLGTVEIFKAKDGYRFRIKDTEGKVIAMPTRGLDSKEDCEKLLVMIRDTLTHVKPTEVKGEK